MPRTRVHMRDALGLSPLPLALSQARLVVAGDAHTPRSRFGVSSLKIMTPRLSVATWLGRARADRLIPIMNFVNRTPTPVRDGWSVEVTQVRDWRGGDLTYNSHNGTDFVVTPGTPVCAAAAGQVVSIRREFNRGGLKIYLDHGGTLITTSNHMTSTMVEVGQQVRRGQIIGLSGYSGIDAVVGFPWVAPHVHYNVWFGGVAADPYAAVGEDEVSLWRVANDPHPMPAGRLADDDAHPTSSFNAAGVALLLSRCLDPRIKQRIAGEPVWRQGAELLIEAITYPTRFDVDDAGRLLFEDPPPRSPRLDLPFLAVDAEGTVAITR